MAKETDTKAQETPKKFKILISIQAAFERNFVFIMLLPATKHLNGTPEE